MINTKILVIDDEESLRYTFKTFLSKEGYNVATAEDYASAMDVLFSTDIDLTIADIILGEHTGFDILQEVKNRGLRCPVIMITGEPNIESAAKSVRLGAFDYLVKPVLKESLLHATKLALQYKSITDEKNLIEAEKERYRRNLEAIFRSVQEAIITVDAEMRVIEVNDATKSICGVSPKDILNKKFVDVLKQCHKVLEETLKTKNMIKEYRIKCRNQRCPRRVVVLNSSPLTDRDNNFVGAVLVIRDITRLSDLEQELKDRYKFYNIISKNSKMQKIHRLIEDLADTETTVLITGESGSGKELIAKALHYSGARSSKPLVKVNCSALSENLLESELFGHVKGSFTGAIKDKLGRFEVADGGTVFLDEIGDISPRIQLKLLRVLQEKEFERVGDSTPVKVDVRVIVATNCHLREKVKKGEFREDLYYRINVVEIKLPPLRERIEDIPLLVDHYYDLFSKKLKKNIGGISNEVLEVFMHYPWPGNVRELEHAIEHAFILCHNQTILLNHLPSEISEYPRDKSHLSEKSPTD